MRVTRAAPSFTVGGAAGKGGLWDAVVSVAYGAAARVPAKEMEAGRCQSVCKWKRTRSEWGQVGILISSYRNVPKVSVLVPCSPSPPQTSSLQAEES